MTTNRWIRMAACLLTAGLMASCLEHPAEKTADSGLATVRAVLTDYADGQPQPSDGEMPHSLAGFHFVDGVLRAVYADAALRPSAGSWRLEVERLEGRLYVVAWTGSDAPPFVWPSTGMTEEAWLSTAVASSPSGSLFYSGTAELTPAAASGNLEVTLRRGMARLELRVEATEGTVEVRSAVVRNVLLAGWLYEHPSSPPGAERGDVTLTEGIAYLHEQTPLTETRAIVDVTMDGRELRLEAPLPSPLRRNTRYALLVRRNAQGATLTVEPWGDGGTADAFPDRGELLTIDALRSTLPQGATLADGGRTLLLPHGAVEGTLCIAAGEELELLSVEGAYRLRLEPLTGGGTAEAMNAFRLSKDLYAPGVEGRDAVVRFRRKGLTHAYPDDSLVLRLLPNPVRLEGPMNFDTDTYEHDFDRYVDNELGLFALPAGSRIALEFDPGEDPWLKLVPGEGADTWRVVAGWRPNDPTADGRRQAARIVMSGSDGGGTDGSETYTVVRRNYGLPVTWFHGIWWCKYNARGRSTHFADQILSAHDPAAAAGQNLYDYLASCSPDDYRTLWEWAYQGSSGQGLRVAEREGRLVMDGFRTDIPDHINRLPPDALAPDGYELPSMDDFNRIFDATDYVWLMWNGTHTLRQPWDGHSLVRREQRRRTDIEVDGRPAGELIFIAMTSPDFPAHEPIVWYGPGAQWDTGGIEHAGHCNNILFGVHSPAGEGWYMAGGLNAFYLHKNGAGNRDTRVLRFKKSEVEYIY